MNYIQILSGILISSISAIFIIPLVIKLCHKYSLLDFPGKHKRHKKPMPIFGGVALFITFWMTVFVALLFFENLNTQLSDSIIYIFMGALIILLVGIADDLTPLAAWVKLAAQISAGLVLFFSGLQVEFLSTPFGSVEMSWFSVFITVIWVVMLTNSINLIDGLDGLASGVSLIGAVTLLIISILYQVVEIQIFIAGLIGFLSVFLYFNRYPARIFLGDSGSMQIGYYFAVVSLIFPLKSYTVSALFIPLLVLAVPILESVSSFVRRLITGKNVLGADRRHLFHFLALAGFSPKQTVTIFYSLAVVFGCFALAMFFWDRLIVFGCLVFFMVVIFAIFFIIITNIVPGRIKNNRRNLKG